MGNSRWHSDGYARSAYRNIKFAFYLDPVGRDSGCLRVIPGSHHRGDEYAESLQDIMSSQRTWSMEDRVGVTGPEMPAVALETRPGDMLMFNQDLKHASFGGGTRRRMFTINVSERFAEKDLDELRQDIGGAARFWIERAYGEAMIKTAGPGRMRHLEQRLANDGHLSELVRQARHEMSEPSRG